MARTWLSIRVDLVSGGGRVLWPRPGRVFAAARSHSFAQLATAIDGAFARWDRSHLHLFALGDDGLVIDRYFDDPPAGARLDERVRLSVLTGGQQFAYVFDLGDDWAHVCTVGAERIDPLEVLGVQPQSPLPFWGWGEIPDQYGHNWFQEDEKRAAPDPELSDLPPLQPGWGPRTIPVH